MMQQIKGKVQQWKHRGKVLKTEENVRNGVWGARYLDSFLLYTINDHDQCNKGN